MRTKGFTLIELLVVIAIIGLLASIVMAGLSKAKSKARYARTVTELQQISTAMELYYEDNGSYPPDVDRGLPPGAEKYINGGVWPTPVYPGSVYDWDNWTSDQMSYAPKEPAIQISVRFCNESGDSCQFPNEPWAAGFDANSALYYCIDGSCRAHSSEPINHPAYCVNCGK